MFQINGIFIYLFIYLFKRIIQVMFYNTNKRFFKQIEKSQSDGAYQKGSFTDMFQV